MHETAVVRNLVAEMGRVAVREGVERIVAAHVRLGALSHLDEDHFREHFAIESRGTPAEGAQLTVEMGQDAFAPDAAEVVLCSVELPALDGAEGGPDGRAAANYPH